MPSSTGKYSEMHEESMVTPASKVRAARRFDAANRCKTATHQACAIRPELHATFTSLQRACQKVSTSLLSTVLIMTTVVATAISGCSPRYHDMPSYWPVPTREYDNYGPGRFKTAYLASQIDKHFRGATPGPIGVTTFVNIDDLYATSTFGRMYAEQLMSELAMHGFDVVELRHSDALQFLDSSGEFALSRDVRAIRPERNLAAIVVGTYVASPERVYVNARLVNPTTSMVLSAGSVEMSRTGELTKLLRGGVMPGSLERIPVRHLNNHAVPMNPFDPARQRQWMAEESGLNDQFTLGSSKPQIPETARVAPNTELPLTTGKGEPQIEIAGRSFSDSGAKSAP